MTDSGPQDEIARTEAKKIVAVVGQRGVIGTTRMVSYWASFENAASVQAAIDEALTQGFLLLERLDAEDDADDSVHDVEFGHEAPMTVDALAPTLARLFQVLAKHGGEFEGWEVETSEQVDE